MSAEQAIRALLFGLLACASTTAAATDEDIPELDFLEYLGMWEESDEEWLMLDETLTADNEERSDPAPEGEESAEKEDEG